MRGGDARGGLSHPLTPPPSPNPRCWQAGSHFNEDVEGKGAEAEFAKLPTEDKEAGPSSAASSTTKA